MGPVTELIKRSAFQAAQENDSTLVKQIEKLKAIHQHQVVDVLDSKLKLKLEKHTEVYFGKFCRHVENLIMQQSNSESTQVSAVSGLSSNNDDAVTSNSPVKQTSGLSINQPKSYVYNFYHQKAALDDEALLRFTSDDAQTICDLYLRQSLVHQAEDIEDRIGTFSASFRERRQPVEKLQDLLKYLCGNKDPDTLQTILRIFLPQYATAVERVISTQPSTFFEHSRKKRVLELENLCKNSKDFLMFVHLKYSSLDQRIESHPKYEDLMAGLLACYVDATLALCHSREDEEEDRMSRKSVAGHLCSVVLMVLRHKPHYSTDVLLQLEQVRPTDSHTLLPLCRKVLEKAGTVVKDPVGYSKYILTAIQVTRWWPDDTWDILKAAQGVPAPAGYLDWLRERAPAVVEELPETKRFRGAAISSFLVSDDLTETIYQQLLDVLSESVAMNDDKDAEADIKENITDLKPTEMFVLDVNPNHQVLDMIMGNADSFMMGEDISDGEGDKMEENVEDLDHAPEDVTFEVYSKEEATKLEGETACYVLESEVHPGQSGVFTGPVMFGTQEVDIIIQENMEEEENTDSLQPNLERDRSPTATDPGRAEVDDATLENKSRSLSSSFKSSGSERRSRKLSLRSLSSSQKSRMELKSPLLTQDRQTAEQEDMVVEDEDDQDVCAGSAGTASSKISRSTPKSVKDAEESQTLTGFSPKFQKKCCSPRVLDFSKPTSGSQFNQDKLDIVLETPGRESEPKRVPLRTRLSASLSQSEGFVTNDKEPDNSDEANQSESDFFIDRRSSPRKRMSQKQQTDTSPQNSWEVQYQNSQADSPVRSRSISTINGENSLVSDSNSPTISPVRHFKVPDVLKCRVHQYESVSSQSSLDLSGKEVAASPGKKSIISQSPSLNLRNKTPSKVNRKETTPSKLKAEQARSQTVKDKHSSPNVLLKLDDDEMTIQNTDSSAFSQSPRRNGRGNLSPIGLFMSPSDSELDSNSKTQARASRRKSRQTPSYRQSPEQREFVAGDLTSDSEASSVKQTSRPVTRPRSTSKGRKPTASPKATNSSRKNNPKSSVGVEHVTMKSSQSFSHPESDKPKLQQQKKEGKVGIHVFDFSSDTDYMDFSQSKLKRKSIQMEKTTPKKSPRKSLSTPKQSPASQYTNSLKKTATITTSSPRRATRQMVQQQHDQTSSDEQTKSPKSVSKSNHSEHSTNARRAVVMITPLNKQSLEDNSSPSKRRSQRLLKISDNASDQEFCSSSQRPSSQKKKQDNLDSGSDFYDSPGSQKSSQMYVPLKKRVCLGKDISSTSYSVSVLPRKKSLASPN